MRPGLALVVGAIGLTVACVQSTSVSVSSARTGRLQVGDRVQMPNGVVSSLLPSGLVAVRMRTRATGDVAADVSTVECDQTLLRLIRHK